MKFNQDKTNMDLPPILIVLGYTQVNGTEQDLPFTLHFIPSEDGYIRRRMINEKSKNIGIGGCSGIQLAALCM